MFMRTCILALLCLSAAAAADVTGTWNVTAITPSGREHKMQMVLKDEGGNLSGTMSGEQGAVALEEVRFAGDELSYRLPVAGGVVVKLTVAGAAMKGAFTTTDGATGKVAASRAAVAQGASVAGYWNCDAKSSSGRQYKLQLDLAEEDGKLSGTVTRADGSVPLDDVKLQGNQLSFKIAADGAVYTVKLTLEGQTFKGSYTSPGGESGSVTGAR